MTERDLVAWATEAFGTLNLTWKLAPAKVPEQRVLGASADQRALCDLTIRHDRIQGASIVIPIDAAYTPLPVFVLAVLVPSATRSEADAWLARQLRRLPQQRPGVIQAAWHQWRVTLTTNTLGLLTLRVTR